MDSETDGNHYASAISETMDRLDMSGTESRAAARSSWNVPSDDNGPTPTDRQRRRQAVRTSVVTEKYHVLPIPISPGVRPPESLARAAMPKSLADSSLPASIFQNNFSYNAVDAVYGASSSEDDTPALPTSVRQPLHGQSTDQVHHMRRPVAGSTTPSLDHRATSFDLGQIGCRYEAPSRLAGLGGSLIPDARQASRTLENGSVRGVAARRTGTRSSTRLALTSEVRSGQAEKSETGYDGDSEGALRVGARVAVQRRNTVAGDKVGEMPALNQRPARMKMSRNTSDYSDLGPSKDERRAMRGSRRRPSTNPLLPIGTQIAPGHANYVLMYNMLTGIRVSVSRCEAKDSRPVRFDDYLAAHKYSFDVVGDEMTPSSRYDFKFKDYAPWVFRCIREAFHLSTEDYLVSLTDKYILSEVGSSGKSGSFFYYSQDYRFIIKTVHHTEHKFMRQILPQYYEFVRDHPNTLLSRIYGLHRIKLPHGRKVHFIVMSNILPPNKDIHAQFDLKGSMLGRELSAELAAKPRACMKDKNWVKMRQRLHLGPAKRRAFVKQLIEDVTLLIRLNIMDYSLLVGVHDLNKGNVAKLRDTTLAMFDPQTTDIQQLNRLTRAHTIRKKVVHTDPVTLDALPLGTVPPLPESMFPELRHSIFYREDGGILSADPNDDPAQFIYYLGVIDILTPYNMVKRTEHFVKAIVHDGSQISAINPRKYGLRFLRFMIHSLEGSEDVLPLLGEFERTTFHEICREHRLF
ncbi:Phosphatidylinositol-4-phosphate 5-kinase [Coemansia sp. IMI 209128]|nr:Phosphatidylinositol-4-phosphate 5-kinase [Coemansia sp. IMI 209128]